VDTNRGDSAAADCIFPLARYRAVSMLDGRQREIRISSWRNYDDICAASAYLVNTIVLRDCGLNAFAIVGAAIEVGIEPTVRHGADLGFIPIVVRDACGAGDEAAGERERERELASLRFTGDAFLTEGDTFCAALRRAKIGSA
jgi:Isochorismatase family